MIESIKRFFTENGVRGLSEQTDSVKELFQVYLSKRMPHYGDDNNLSAQATHPFHSGLDPWGRRRFLLQTTPGSDLVTLARIIPNLIYLALTATYYSVKTSIAVLAMTFMWMFVDGEDLAATVWKPFDALLLSVAKMGYQLMLPLMMLLKLGNTIVNHKASNANPFTPAGHQEPNEGVVPRPGVVVLEQRAVIEDGVEPKKIYNPFACALGSDDIDGDVPKP